MNILSKGILTLIVRATSDSASPSDSELDASSSESEEGREHAAPQRKRLTDDVEDEESSVTAAATYLQTKNEIVDANFMVPTISEVEPCDKLEKVGEIMSIVGNVVIVRGLPADPVNSLSKCALDAESLLVFEDRKVLGYVSHVAFYQSMLTLSCGDRYTRRSVQRPNHSIRLNLTTTIRWTPTKFGCPARYSMFRNEVTLYL